jgi:hypothetical protein
MTGTGGVQPLRLTDVRIALPDRVLIDALSFTVEAGRRALQERHEPARVVADLLSVYQEVCGSLPAARSEGS